MHTCDKFCGRSCLKADRHIGHCDCGTDCAATAGPFDHLAIHTLLVDDVEESTEVEAAPAGVKARYVK